MNFIWGLVIAAAGALFTPCGRTKSLYDQERHGELETDRTPVRVGRATSALSTRAAWNAELAAG